MKTTLSIPIPGKSLPYNFDYHLLHYVFQPWVVEGKELARLFQTPAEGLMLARVGFQEKPKPSLLLSLESKKAMTPSDIQWITELTAWMFAVNEEVQEFYEDICRKDPVLKAASESIYGAHLRRDPYVLESVIGVVVAQNVYFQRIYDMMERLCRAFGEKELFAGKTYHTFPTAEAFANASLAEIRNCKVGYRDKYIKGIAEKIVNEHIDLDALRKVNDIRVIREKLIELPGVGPYTADLAIAIGFRIPNFHLDLFSREALYVFYFKGRKVSDKTLSAFVEKRWGKWKHYAMLCLTTNTDEWAKKLGKKFRLKSAAQDQRKAESSSPL
ncbi:MAG: DNA-3-methyladenine glycosylase 2 family protein [Candidatus Wildermuthbacteria bacterium]|nr:DNA-3-methyladenine glycosylase 2 family protein [Candidatus Wildermuthbacteria bacterium]